MAIDRLPRRAVLAGAAAGMVGVSGCAASDEPDAVVEFTVRTGDEPDVIPDDTRDHYGQDGYEWVVVEIAVKEGELEMEDVWFHSRIETEDRYHDLDHASDEIPDGIQSRGAVQEDGEAVAVYQIPEESEVVAWDLSEMDQQIDAKER